jgi:hypothetical protein
MSHDVIRKSQLELRQAYDDLFHGGADEEESLDDLLEDDFDTDLRQRRRMSSG